MPIEMAPVGILLLGALIAAVVPARIAALTTLITPLAAAWAALTLLKPGSTATWSIMAYQLEPVRADHFSLVMVGLFLFAALAAAIYGLGIRDRLQHASLLLYIAGGTGAVLAGDMISFFVFFELIGLGGTLLVLAARTPEASAAAVRYLVFQVTAGLTLLAGILTVASSSGDWSFRAMDLQESGAWLMMLAFGIKAGIPLLHGWIVDAYPKASLIGLAVLVAVTTKVGIYGLAHVFAGEGILVGVGTVMALWPLFYTLVENDLKRVVAYAMLVQLGLMVAGVGVGSAIALDGVAMHIVMDVLFKMTLFMALGVVLLRVGTTRADRLGGLWRHMPLTTTFVAVAVAANVALPLTGGFISKKTLLAGIEYGEVPVVVWAVLVSLSAMGTLYAGVRVLWEGFLKPPGSRQPASIDDAPAPMAAAMGLLVVALLLTGTVPGLTDWLRPQASDYTPLYAGKIIGHMQMLLFSLAAYVLLVRAGFGLPRSRPATWLDAEWLYRRALPTIAGVARRALISLRNRALQIIGRMSTPGHGRVSATLERSWPIGLMGLWAAALLAALLLFGIRSA